MKQVDSLVAALVGGLLMFLALWLTVQPVSAKEVHEYVRLTVERRLDNIEDGLKELRQGQVELQKGLAGVEAILLSTQ